MFKRFFIFGKVSKYASIRKINETILRPILKNFQTGLGNRCKILIINLF